MFTPTDRGFPMSKTAQAAATQPARAQIPGVASLKTDPERLARMWAMTPAQRLQAAQTGRLTLAEMLAWARRAPNEIPVVDGEWFFITALAE